MALVNKKWRKDASDNALNAGMRVLGAIGTSILLQKAPDFFKSENVKNTVNNILPPLVTAGLVAGDLFLETPALRSICQGGYSFAFLKSVARVVQGSGNYMGLQGISTGGIMHGIRTNGIMNGTPVKTPTLPPIPSKPALPTTTATQTPAQKTFSRVAEYAERVANNDAKTAASISGVADVAKAQSVAESML